MSRHSTHSHYHGHQVLVVAGYDRPLNEVFLQVWRTDAAGEPVDPPVYSSIHEPRRDWSTIDTLTQRLEAMHIAVPQSLLEAVVLDQALRVGNRIAWHDGPAARTSTAPA